MTFFSHRREAQFVNIKTAPHFSIYVHAWLARTKWVIFNCLSIPESYRGKTLLMNSSLAVLRKSWKIDDFFLKCPKTAMGEWGGLWIHLITWFMADHILTWNKLTEEQAINQDHNHTQNCTFFPRSYIPFTFNVICFSWCRTNFWASFESFFEVK